MKISQAESILQSLETFKDVKGVVGYNLAVNQFKLMNELTVYHKMKNDLFQKYGEEVNGQLVINKMSENYTKYLVEIAPIEEQEINVDFLLFSDEQLKEATDLTKEQQLFIMFNFMEKQ